jgi:predicted transcriptional regulator
MEVRLSPELEAQLQQLAARSGREAGEVVESAGASYLDEVAGLGSLLDRRYQELESGRVIGIEGANALARLREKSEACRVGRDI